MTDREKDTPADKAGRSDPGGGDDLVSLLYGELDEDAANRLTAEMESDTQLRNAHDSLADVRDLFAQLDEYEPPARLSAQLLAEAAKAPHVGKAKAAPAAETGQSWWQRFMAWCQPLAQRPAFAAAASLVLVAGIAGVLYVKKGDELTETRRHEAEKVDVTAPVAPPADPAPGTAEEAMDDGLAGSDMAVEPEPSDGDMPPGTALSGGGTKAEASKSGERRRAARTQAPAKSAATSKSSLGSPDDDAYGGRASTILGLSEETLAPSEGAEQKPSGKAGAARDYAEPPARSAPPPSPEPEVQQKARPLTAREMHSRAIDAAQSNDCTQVRRLLDQIRSRDVEYYKTTVAGDKRLAACRTPSKATKSRD